MKKMLGLLFLITLIGCSQSGQQNNSITKTNSTTKGCDKSIKLGVINICLPEIDGMTESYSSPTVRELLAKSMEGNTILGYYLNNETYKQVNRIKEISFDNYFVIYSVNAMKDKKAGQSDLKEASDLMGSNFSKENWNDFKRNFDLDKNILTMGRPVLIESYSLNDKVRTFEVLVKYQMNNAELMQVITMNILLIKDRLIWLGYYKDYDGQESIKNAKSKNNYIALMLLDENK